MITIKKFFLHGCVNTSHISLFLVTDRVLTAWQGSSPPKQ